MARWYCARSLPQSESLAVRELQNQHFETFLPLEDTGKTIRPVFVGYFFVQFDRERDRWRSILGTRGVKTLLGLVGDNPQPLPHGCVEDLQRRAAAGDFGPKDDSSVVLPDIAPGSSVRVLGGTFQGFNGICQKSDRERVFVLLDLFKRTMPVPLQRQHVERVA